MQDTLENIREEVVKWRATKKYSREPMPKSLKKRIFSLRSSIKDKVLQEALGLYSEFFDSKPKQAKKSPPTPSSPFLKLPDIPPSKPRPFLLFKFANGSELEIYQ